MNNIFRMFLKGIIYMIMTTILFIPAILLGIVAIIAAGVTIGVIGIVVTFAVTFFLILFIAGYVIGYIERSPGTYVTAIKRGFIILLLGFVMGLILPDIEYPMNILLLAFKALVYGYIIPIVVGRVK